MTASEIGNSSIEACKAQAVAARTFALRRVRNRGYVYDTTIDQAFIASRNDIARYPNAVKAAEQTAGQILTYRGTILLDCPYGAGNGGKTKAYKNYPYLIERQDPYDTAERQEMQSRGERTRMGNGYGMSQYGARNMAKNGMSYKDILSFYYPNTDISYAEMPENEIKEADRVPINKKEKDIKEWALAQVGCGYVWGATGQVLTRQELDKLIARHGANVKMPTAEKWIGKKVFDCAGLVSQAVRINLRLSMVSGASSQWKGNYWDKKGTVDTLPKDRVVILYREAPTANPMQHTGIYLGNGQVVDARGTSSGVLLSDISKYAWTHWAVPKGLHDDAPSQSDNPKKENEVSKLIGKATVKNGNLALRDRPSTDGKLILYMPDKAEVSVIDTVGTEWMKVQYGTRTGYAMAKYLDYHPTSPPVNANTSAVTKHFVKIECATPEEATNLARLLKTVVVE